MQRMICLEIVLGRGLFRTLTCDDGYVVHIDFYMWQGIAFSGTRGTRRIHRFNGGEIRKVGDSPKRGSLKKTKESHCKIWLFFKR